MTSDSKSSPNQAVFIKVKDSGPDHIFKSLVSESYSLKGQRLRRNDASLFEFILNIRIIAKIMQRSLIIVSPSLIKRSKVMPLFR